jgi:hypothetical protein
MVRVIQYGVTLIQATHVLESAESASGLSRAHG